MAFWDEEKTWVALDGAAYNKTVSVISTEKNVTITGVEAGTGMIQLWSTVDTYVTVTDGDDEVAATANSLRLMARDRQEWPVKSDSTSVSSLRMGSTNGYLYISTIKLA